MPDTYDGSAKSVEQLRDNVVRAGLVGNLVANDFKSSTIVLPLLDVDPATGKAIDYGDTDSKSVEQNVRAKYETADGKYQGAHHRLRQDHRRAARRRAAGDDVLRHRVPDRGGAAVLLHALLAQHVAGAVLFADRGRLADRAS